MSSLLAQLNGARALVRRDPSQFPALVRMIGPVSDRPEPEIRRWCSGFLVDFLVSEDVRPNTKKQVFPELWPALDKWIQDSDFVVLKSAITALSLVFPLLFNEPSQSGKLLEMKTRALALWDSQSPLQGVQVACIKFAQVVVHAQTQKPLPPHLDAVMQGAEAAGLLDRLLGYFSEPRISMQQLSATVNAVLPLARERSALAPKIIQTLATFDVSRKQPQPSALVLRWVAKLFQLQLSPFSRQNPGLQRYIQGLSEWCANQSLKKRAAESALGSTENQNPSKRAKRVLPEGEAHYSDLYALVDTTVARFNARDLQLPLAVEMALAGLIRVDPDILADCLDVVRDRAAGIRAEDPRKAQQEMLVSRLIGLAASRENSHGDNWRLVVRLAVRGVDSSSKASNALKEKLYTHVMADIRGNLEPMVLWLSEEWYAAHVLELQPVERYTELVDRVVDQILPRLEADDSRMFVRLLSELPELPQPTVSKLRSILVDPERAVVGVRALKFLIMFKPPARKSCLDLVENVWRTEKMPSLEQILRKFRPEALELDQSDKNIPEPTPVAQENPSSTGENTGVASDETIPKREVTPDAA